MASDPPNTGAAFTDSLELDLIKIQDLNTGTKRVADDIKNVLRKFECWHQGSIIGHRIMYLESNCSGLGSIGAVRALAFSR